MTTPSRAGFPLAALFFLTALAAVLSALAAPGWSVAFRSWDNALEVAICAGVGAAIGFLLACGGFRWWGWLLGPLTGLAVGFVAGLMWRASPAATTGLFAITVGGAALLVFGALLTLHWSERGQD